MHYMKKLLCVLLIVALALTSVFAQGSNEAKTEAKSGYKFGFTCMDQSNPFFVLIEQTVRDAVEKNGDKLISVDPANDVTRQIQQIEDLIAQGIDGIFLNPAEAEGVIPALDQLKAAEIGRASCRERV